MHTWILFKIFPEVYISLYIIILYTNSIIIIIIQSCQFNVHFEGGVTGRGWASVLNTHSSRRMRSSSEKMRYKYLRVSAKKKLCWTSSCDGGTWYTSRIPLNPTPTRQCFSMAWVRRKELNLRWTFCFPSIHYCLMEFSL